MNICIVHIVAVFSEIQWTYFLSKYIISPKNNIKYHLSQKTHVQEISQSSLEVLSKFSLRVLAQIRSHTPHTQEHCFPFWARDRFVSVPIPT